MYLQDIVAAADRIASYVKGMTRSEFEVEQMRIDAVMYGATTSGAHGVIDEFAIYSEALSQKDIQRDMEVFVSDVEPEGKLAVAWGRIKAGR